MGARGWLATLIHCAVASSAFAAGAHGPLHLRVPMAPTAVVVEDSRRFVYELHVGNGADDAVVLVALEVFDGDAPDAPLAAWSGDALLARTAIVGGPGLPDAKHGLPSGSRAVIYIEFDLPVAVGGPRELTHRLRYAAITPAGRAVVDLRGGATRPQRLAATRIGPPLRSGPWIAVYSAAFPRGHRRVLFGRDSEAKIPARFAIDWIRLDRRGRQSRGDAELVSSWFGYGDDVLAVADGTVVATRFDYPESPTLDNPAHLLDEASGNFVSLDIGDGRYAHYEHLKPASVRVRPGQRVRRGQRLGALGFTGDSTGPHLHFHISDGATPQSGEGQPFVIDRYRMLGTYVTLDDFAAAKSWPPLPEGAAPLRSATLPAPGAVVQFAR